MFITEKQLALYKHMANSEYFGKSMSYIAFNEYLKFAEISDKAKFVIDCFSHFWTRKVSEKIWQVYFSDQSYLLIKLSEKNETETYIFKIVSDIFDYSDLFSDADVGS